jgi:hypothetical protein
MRFHSSSHGSHGLFTIALRNLIVQVLFAVMKVRVLEESGHESFFICNACFFVFIILNIVYIYLLIFIQDS